MAFLLKLLILIGCIYGTYSMPILGLILVPVGFFLFFILTDDIGFHFWKLVDPPKDKAK